MWQDQIIYLDANFVIRFIEDRILVSDSLKSLAATIDGHNCQLFTSVLTCFEALVKPLRDNNQKLVGQFQSFFKQDNLMIVDVNQEIIEQALLLAKAHGFRLADAIHLATAKTAGCSIILSDDVQWQRIDFARLISFAT